MIIDPLGIVPVERGGTGATTLEEAKEKLGIASNNEGTVLFSSSSGKSNNITLSDDVSNYSLVMVIATKYNDVNPIILPIQYQQGFIVRYWDNSLGSNTPYLYYRYGIFAFSGNTLNRTSGSEIAFSKSGGLTYRDYYVSVYKVIGYK